MTIIRLWIGLWMVGIASVSFAAPQATETAKKQEADTLEFDRLEDNSLIFKPLSNGTTPKPLKTGLFEVTFLGKLTPTEGGAPYFVVIGKPCQNCLEEKAVYVLRPTADKPTAFVYPGRILEPKSKAVLLESRAFFGKCLPRKGDIYVVFQKERVDRRSRLQSSVLIAEAAKEHLAELLLERHLPNVKTALQMVKRKSCKEIEGRNRLMLRKPLDLRPRNNHDSDDDDDESENSDKNQAGEQKPAVQPEPA